MSASLGKTAHEASRRSHRCCTCFRAGGTPEETASSGATTTTLARGKKNGRAQQGRAVHLDGVGDGAAEHIAGMSNAPGLTVGDRSITLGLCAYSQAVAWCCCGAKTRATACFLAGSGQAPACARPRARRIEAQLPAARALTHAEGVDSAGSLETVMARRREHGLAPEHPGLEAQVQLRSCMQDDGVSSTLTVHPDGFRASLLHLGLPKGGCWASPTKWLLFFSWWLEAAFRRYAPIAETLSSDLALRERGVVMHGGKNRRP